MAFQISSAKGPDNPSSRSPNRFVAACCTAVQCCPVNFRPFWSSCREFRFDSEQFRPAPRTCRYLPGQPWRAVSWQRRVPRGSHARRKTARVHHAARRRGSGLAGRGACAAACEEARAAQRGLPPLLSVAASVFCWRSRSASRRHWSASLRSRARRAGLSVVSADRAHSSACCS